MNDRKLLSLVLTPAGSGLLGGGCSNSGGSGTSSGAGGGNDHGDLQITMPKILYSKL